MMYALLKCLGTLPLRPEKIEPFLRATVELAAIDVITIDDWNYLLRLLAFRIHKYVLEQAKGAMNGTRN